jgi:hypothetical protein
MERLRQSLPTCSPAACCESEALDDPLDAGILSELNYGNWMSDVANRLWNIPLVRLAHASGAHTAGGEQLVAGPGAPSVRAPSTPRRTRTRHALACATRYTTCARFRTHALGREAGGAASPPGALLPARFAQLLQLQSVSLGALLQH